MRRRHQSLKLENATDKTEALPAARVRNEPRLAELRVSDFLPPPNWPAPQETLAEICLCLTEAVPCVESAGVVVLQPVRQWPVQRHTLDGAVVIGAAPAGGAVLEMERRLDEGPVLTACQVETVVLSGDLSTDERWRRFGSAVADLQWRSAAAMPLPGINGVTRAVLSIYSRQHDAFDRGVMHLIAAVANIVRNAILNTELLDRTRRAFEAMTSRSNEDLAAAAGTIVDEARKEAHLGFIAAGHRPSHT